MLLNRLHLKSNRHSIQRYYNVSWFFDISHRWDTIKMNGRSQSTLFYGKLKRNWFHMMDSSLRNLILMMFGGVTVNVANARWKVVVDSDFEVMRSNLGNRLHFTMPVFSKFINRYTQTKKAKNKQRNTSRLLQLGYLFLFWISLDSVINTFNVFLFLRALTIRKTAGKGVKQSWDIFETVMHLRWLPHAFNEAHWITRLLLSVIYPTSKNSHLVEFNCIVLVDVMLNASKFLLTDSGLGLIKMIENG